MYRRRISLRLTYQTKPAPSNAALTTPGAIRPGPARRARKKPLTSVPRSEVLLRAVERARIARLVIELIPIPNLPEIVESTSERTAVFLPGGQLMA